MADLFLPVLACTFDHGAGRPGRLFLHGCECVSELQLCMCELPAVWFNGVMRLMCVHTPMHTLMLTTAQRRQCKVTANPTPTVELFVGDTIVWELQDTDRVVEHDGPTTCVPRVSRIQTRVGVDPTGRHSYVPRAAFALRCTSLVLRLLCVVHPRMCCIRSVSQTCARC